MWLYTLFPIICRMSFMAGIVIAAVLLARLPLRRVPKIFSYMLWSVVLFRLLCPVAVSTSFSLFGIFETSALTTEQTIILSENPVGMDGGLHHNRLRHQILWKCRKVVRLRWDRGRKTQPRWRFPLGWHL